MKTEQGIKIYEIRDKITPENRICTLEQAEVYMKALESFIVEMEPTENARDNRPLYRTYNEEHVQADKQMPLLIMIVSDRICIIKCRASALHFVLKKM